MLVKSYTANRVFPINNPNTGEDFFRLKEYVGDFLKKVQKKMLLENRFYFGKDGKGAPQVKRYLNEVKNEVTAKTIFFREEVGDNQEVKKEVTIINSDSVFAAPKPERLIERVLTLGSNEADLVLDSFLGSRVIIVTTADSDDEYWASRPPLKNKYLC